MLFKGRMPRDFTPHFSLILYVERGLPKWKVKPCIINMGLLSYW